MRAPDHQPGQPIPAKAGIGLRFPHHQAVLDTRPDVAWMEVHTENYMGGGTPLRYLDAIRRDTPISLHGVGLSLGSAEGIDPAHLERIRKVAERIEPGLMSEHIAWNVVGGTYLADLLPLPMTEEALEVVCRHVDQTQSYLRRRILVENPSTYIAFGNSIIPEWEFMAAVAARTGCGILCDVNNICVSAHNHGWDASAYIAALPPDAVGEIHLAGHSIKTLADGSTLRIDDHGSRVSEEVWALYGEAIARFGAVPTLIEWDNDVPPLDVLLHEADHAAGFIAAVDGGSVMPTLLELQTAMQASLVHRDNEAVSAMLAGHIPADRLDIYRNTFVHTLTRALRLSFPATERLVGEDFFEGAAQFFIADIRRGRHGSTCMAANFRTFCGIFRRLRRSFISEMSPNWNGR